MCILYYVTVTDQLIAESSAPTGASTANVYPLVVGPPYILFLTPVTVQEICVHVNRFNLRKAPGFSGISLEEVWSVWEEVGVKLTSHTEKKVLKVES